MYILVEKKSSIWIKDGKKVIYQKIKSVEKNEAVKLYRVSQERGRVYTFNKVVRKDCPKQEPFQRTMEEIREGNNVNIQRNGT